MSDILKTVEELGPLADKVTDLAVSQDAAHDEETEAKTALLDAVVERVKPALRALSSRIQDSYRSWWPDTVYPVEEETYLDERGLRVAGNGPEEDHPRANSGSYVGSDLYILAVGTWLRVTYSGHWSRWQGRSSEWTASTTEPTTAEVAATYDVEDIIQPLADALERQLRGKREKATAAALRRAETMTALATLLRGGVK